MLKPEIYATIMDFFASGLPVVNEDANAKLIRELKDEINRLRDLLKQEGIEVEDGEEMKSSLCERNCRTFVAVENSTRSRGIMISLPDSVYIVRSNDISFHRKCLFFV